MRCCVSSIVSRLVICHLYLLGMVAARITILNPQPICVYVR